MKVILFLILCFFNFGALANSPDEKIVETTGPGYHFGGVDVDLDFGHFVSQHSPWGGRLRVGGVKAVDDLFYSLGLSVGYSGALGMAAGVEFEAMSLQSGFWGQLAILTSESHSLPYFKTSAGWSLVGMDFFWLPQPKADAAWMALVKLRIPFHLIGLAIANR